MILDLHRQGLSVSAIARQAGIDRKTGAQVHRASATGTDLSPAQAKSNGDRPVRGPSSRTGAVPA